MRITNKTKRAMIRIWEMEKAYSATLEAEGRAVFGTESEEHAIILRAGAAVNDAINALYDIAKPDDEARKFKESLE